MPTYRVAAGSVLTVKARSRIHDTTTVWDTIAGTVEVDPETVATTSAATVDIAVDMTKFDAGDFLKNRKLRKDFDLEAHPRATFSLTGLEGVTRDGAKLAATARGILRWRGKEVPLTIQGTGTLDARSLHVRASFDLDIRHLGLSAPRFLIFKMEDEVTIDVVLVGATA